MKDIRKINLRFKNSRRFFKQKTGDVDYLIKIRAAGIIKNIKNYKSLNSYKIKKVSVEQVYRINPD